MRNAMWSMPTKVFFSEGCVEKIPTDIKNYFKTLGKKTFILTSPSFASTSKRDELKLFTEQLKSNGIEFEIGILNSGEPTLDQINALTAQARKWNPKFLIAFGGGSVMDAAKCICLLLANEGTLPEYSHRGIHADTKRVQKALDLVCIPTVFATGSEVSQYAVYTDEKSKLKLTVFSEHLKPVFALVDPKFALTISYEQTVYNCFDVLTHSLESYLSTSEDHGVLDRTTEAIVSSVFASLEKIKNDSKNMEARMDVARASVLAMSGFLSLRSGGWPIHALAHGLAAYYKLPHGALLTVLLPRFVDFYVERGSEKAKKIKSFFPKEFFKSYTLTKLLKDVPVNLDILEKAVDHALQLDGIWKKGDEPYLKAFQPIFKNDGLSILKNCL